MPARLTLQVANLEKTFTRGHPVVKGVSFSIAEGEIVALLGPSGCGKTSTLRLVAGLEAATGGSIWIGDQVVDSVAAGVFVPPQKRNIGMVFQSYAVWPHMTVAENVRYPLKSKQYKASEGADVNARVAELLDLVGLAKLANRPVTSLSGGQMQRVALARSLVYRPKLLLLDEPLSNLDAKLRVRLREDLRRILKATNVTALYVTHDQEEAIVIGDRIGIMDEGELIQINDVLDLYNRPLTSFVADFTGATNELVGKVVKQDAENVVVSLDGGSLIDVMAVAPVCVGAIVTVRTRPGNIILYAKDNPATTNTIVGEVIKRTFLGVSIIYDVKIAGSTVQSIESGSRMKLNVGDLVQVHFDPRLTWAYNRAQALN